MLQVPYERRASPLFGAIRRPIAPVALYSSAWQRWLIYAMILDTGADYSVLPASVARDLGISLAAGERHQVAGVGGQQRVWLHRAVRMRVGAWEFHAPVGFLEHDAVPPLFGRYHALDRFDLRFCDCVTTFLARP